MAGETELLLGERVDDLQTHSLKIIQQTHAFCFGTDAVLLADFCRVQNKDHVCDLGTGTGILPLLLYARAENAHFDALEIQSDMANMAQRSVAMNHLDKSINVQCGDLRQISDYCKRAAYSLVVCNPPYGRSGETIKNDNQAVAVSRHEETCSLEDVIHAAAYLLKFGGRFCMIFPSARIPEAIKWMQHVHMEPKRLRLICSYIDKPPRLALMEGIMGAKPSLNVLPPLVLYTGKNEYTKELKKIYGIT